MLKEGHIVEETWEFLVWNFRIQAKSIDMNSHMSRKFLCETIEIFVFDFAMLCTTIDMHVPRGNLT